MLLKMQKNYLGIFSNKIRIEIKCTGEFNRQFHVVSIFPKRVQEADEFACKHRKNVLANSFAISKLLVSSPYVYKRRMNSPVNTGKNVLANSFAIFKLLEYFRNRFISHFHVVSIFPKRIQEANEFACTNREKCTGEFIRHFHVVGIFPKRIQEANLFANA